MEKKDVEIILEFIKKGEESIGHERSNEAILIIGPSGSGKSTLICTLNEYPLRALVDDETGDLVIDAVSSEGLKKEGLIIEHKSQAGTALPKKLVIKDQCFWDTPGFEDNKGAKQDLANAFYLRKIIKLSSKIKIIFTVMYSNMEGRAKVFLNSLKLFCNAFCNNEQYLDSVGLMITNTPSHVNSNNIKYQIETDILEAKELNLNKDTLNFLKHFVSNPKKIIVMKKPEIGRDLREFYSDFRNDVFTILKNLKSISVVTPNLILSNDTINELPNIMERKAEPLEEVVKLVHKQVEDFVTDKFGKVKFDSNLEDNLRSVENCGTLIEDFHKAKNKKNMDDLYKIFREYHLNTTHLEFIKNVIEFAELFRAINRKIKLETYMNTIFNSPDTLTDHYKKLQAEMPLRLRSFLKSEFAKWRGDFQANPNITKIEHQNREIVNLVIESSKQTDFDNFFKTLNVYENLTSKYKVKDLNEVIKTIDTYFKFYDEGNDERDLNEMQDYLVQAYIAKFENLIELLKNKGKVDQNKNKGIFSSCSVL